MIKDQSIFIAHWWSDVMLCRQSKELALELSKNDIDILNTSNVSTIVYQIQWIQHDKSYWKYAFNDVKYAS